MNFENSICQQTRIMKGDFYEKKKGISINDGTGYGGDGGSTSVYI